jgi:kynurenine formamidase
MLQGIQMMGDLSEVVNTRMTLEEFESLFDELKNWERWGPDDRLGTLNYLTPAQTARAANNVRSGRSVSLSLPVNTIAGPDNPHPAIHYMAQGHDVDIDSGGLRMATDFLGIQFHGDCHSHIDALCHVSYRGILYNGLPASVVTTTGARAQTIDDYRHGIIGRGVLLDIPRLHNAPWVELGHAVTYEELAAAEQAQGVEVGEGDVLVFRTGEHRRRLELGPWDAAVDGRAGLHPTALRFFAERRVAVFAPDGDGETLPSPVDGIMYPIHPLQITAMGMAAMDSLQFEDLVAACEEEQRWEFLFLAAPLRLTAGTGSPINPIAVF